MSAPCLRVGRIKRGIEGLFGSVAPELGLSDWKLTWSISGGYCWLGSRAIQLRDIERDDHATYWEVAGHLIHEIAHALAQPSEQGSQHTHEFHDVVRRIWVDWHSTIAEFEVTDGV